MGILQASLEPDAGVKVPLPMFGAVAMPFPQDVHAALPFSSWNPR
jgi:hypothetical protein